jgi:FAD/FMN-containing dehydrogenase
MPSLDSLTLERHAAALRDMLGGGAVVTDASGKASYEAGARYDAGKAALVVRPATTPEVARALAYCVGYGLAVVPQSGNTGLVSASTPDGSGAEIVLSLDRLAEPFELDTANRSVRVGAGMRLSELNRRLEPHGLFFPIDLSADPCLGGMVATNTGGARFLRYGDVRRNVLGLAVVLADAAGTVLQLGRGLRKDNTGADWKHLFIGTSGTFGLVTECWLNLEPLPLQRESVILVPAESGMAVRLLQLFEAQLGGSLTAFEGMSGNAMDAALRHVPRLRNPFGRGEIPGYAILAEFTRTWADRAGEQSLRTVLEDTLAGIWESEPGLLADAIFGASEDLWALRHAISEGVQKSGKLVAFDLSFTRGAVMDFRNGIAAECARRYPDIRVCDFGHIGDGGIHMNLVVPPEHAGLQDPAWERELRNWVVEVAVSDYGGSFSAEHGIGRTNQRFYDAYTPDALKRMAHGLYAATSPGRLGAIRLD